MNANWDIQRIARATLIIAVAFAGVLPACFGLGRHSRDRHLAAARRFGQTGDGQNAVASLLTLLVAVVLVLPLIRLGVEAANDGRAIAQWVSDIDQKGLRAPDWLPHLPYVGNTLVDWWQANLAAPGAARALFGRADISGMFNVTRTLGIEVANRLTILVFTLLALFFLYRDGPRVIKEANANAERLFGPFGGHLGKNAVAAVRGTVNGLVLVGLGEGVLLGVAYMWRPACPTRLCLVLRTAHRMGWARVPPAAAEASLNVFPALEGGDFHCRRRTFPPDTENG